MNKNVFFVTNNCMKTREEYLEKFKKLKIQAEVNQVDFRPFCGKIPPTPLEFDF